MSVTMHVKDTHQMPETHVRKRNGELQPVHLDKITNHLKALSYELKVDPIPVAIEVVKGIYDGVSTRELEELAAETAVNMSPKHPDYGILAGRIAVLSLQKDIDKSFVAAMKRLYTHVHNGKHTPLIHENTYNVVVANASKFESRIIHRRDMSMNYFAFKTLARSYLLKINDEIVERPQHMWLRVAIGIHGEDVDAAIETYDLMSQGFFVHATPTLYNSGTPRPQMSSCFLLTMQSDSIEGIYSTLQQCAMISKYAGGIGLSIHDVRAKESFVAGTNGRSNGIVPMLRVYDATARYVDQGGGKRKGSFAMYLEPWHADIEEFLELKKNTGKEEYRARDLFYALWTPDLFMKRVAENQSWSLFSPDEAIGLADTFGAEFEALYEKYESEGKARKTVSAQALWTRILKSQSETGLPYMMYKDACNSKSNQQNLGTIRSSNLCAEVVQYSSPDEIAVCNLGSIGLPKFVEGRRFNFEKLGSITATLVRNLNNVIDRTYYPLEETRRSNLKHRPMGIGIQGLADVFQLMGYAFTSPEARALNRDIAETMYYYAVRESMLLAQRDGPYESFIGSPMSQGRFQFDLWNETPSDRYDWAALREDVMAHGVRNSLLIALMPTASTSQILGNNECFEPYTSNIFSRRTLSGDFWVVNEHLVRDLMRRGLYSERLLNDIIAHQGSIQNLDLPNDMKEIYRTVWEIKQRDLVEMARDRAPFVCQSQSMNVFFDEATTKKLTGLHMYAWKLGLKTGMYYCRTLPRAEPIAGLGIETRRTPPPTDECTACSA